MPPEPGLPKLLAGVRPGLVAQQPTQAQIDAQLRLAAQQIRSNALQFAAMSAQGSGLDTDELLQRAVAFADYITEG